MECMGALISNDGQVEGCFTAYNAALERPALEMDLYWAHAPAPPAHAPPAPRPDSPFAGRLKQALNSTPPERESWRQRPRATFLHRSNCFA
jgi:hypothetical protein